MFCAFLVSWLVDLLQPCHVSFIFACLPSSPAHFMKGFEVTNLALLSCCHMARVRCYAVIDTQLSIPCK